MEYIGPRQWVLVCQNMPVGIFDDDRTARTYASDKLGKTINWEGHTNYFYSGVDQDLTAWTLKNTPVYGVDDL
jgi:hypothetical protein